MPDPTPETYPAWREEWEREDGWRARKAEVNMLLAVIDQREDMRLYDAAISVIHKLIAMHMPAERHWDYFFADVENLGGLTDTERTILDHAREVPDA